jgi:hypothetical protein
MLDDGHGSQDGAEHTALAAPESADVVAAR